MIQIIPEQEYIRPQKTGDRTNHTENTMTPNDEIKRKRRDEWEKKNNKIMQTAIFQVYIGFFRSHLK